MKLRATTKEEQEKHVKALKQFKLEAAQLRMGYDEGLISKSQMKKGLAKSHNDGVEYIKENKIVPFMGYLYIEEE